MCAMVLARPAQQAIPLVPSSLGNPLLSSRNSSLVFNCEVPEVDTKPLHSRPRKSAAYLSSLKERLAILLAANGPFCSRLLRDVREFSRVVRYEENGDVDAVVLATKLSNVGYAVCVRNALGGGSSCFRNLRHEFLLVRGQGDYEGAEFIVEPRFKEQFAIPHPTEEYLQVLESIPAEFVGTSSRLVPIVQIMCLEMADSFESRGLTTPPWRKTQSMLSKWMPTKHADVSFGRVSAPLDSMSSTASFMQNKLTHASEDGSVSSHAHAVEEEQQQQPSQQQQPVDMFQRRSKSPPKSLLSACLTSPASKVVCNPPEHWGQPPIHTVKFGFKLVQQQI